MSYVNNFVMEDYFIIFLAIMIMILIVLILALIKTRNQYYEEILNESLKNQKLFNFDKKEEVVLNSEEIKDSNEVEDVKEVSDFKENIEYKDYYSLIDKYEVNEEENAVISTDELERRKLEKFDELGVSDNEAMIQRYEEEQEKKAIISYEQLLKNASNIVVSYTEEDIESGSPKINKITIDKKEVTEAQSYIEEEKFLKILKDFRTSLPS